MIEKHKKHSEVTKSNVTLYGKRHVCIVGTTCAEVKDYGDKIVKSLSPRWKLSFVDADHQAFDNDLRSSLMKNGLYSHWLDKQNFQTQEFNHQLNDWDKKLAFQQTDLTILNGNHFQGENQIIILNESKFPSLEKRLDQIQNVWLILKPNDLEIPTFLNNHLDLTKIKIIDTNQVDRMIQEIENHLHDSIPELTGLILTGGKSERMGKDKSNLSYHGVSQWEYLSMCFESLKLKSVISCRKEQQDAFAPKTTLPDSFEGLGPYGALLSAFKSDPNKAYLVIACDLPFVGTAELQLLIDCRNPSKIATAFLNEETGFPDPLFTIWEPKAYPRILSFLSLGNSCPRKVLINSDIEHITGADQKMLKNVNTPEQFKEVLDTMN